MTKMNCLKSISLTQTIRTLFLFSSILLASSCLDEPDYRQETVYKPVILNYFNQLKDSKTQEEVLQLNELTKAIDFYQVNIYPLITTEQAIIADLKPINSYGEVSKMKAIFFLNQNEIVRSIIVTFNDQSSADYNQIILSILNMDESKKIIIQAKYLFTDRFSIYFCLTNLKMENSKSMALRCEEKPKRRQVRLTSIFV